MRIQPNLPSHAYTTFQIAAPISTHWRKATCDEVDCAQYRNGWKVRVEGLPPEMLHAATHSGRRYHQLDVNEQETWLVFEAGQPCFQQALHRVRVGLPERFLVRSGDFRNLGQPREHTRPEFWVEEFAENQNHLATAINRG